MRRSGLPQAQSLHLPLSTSQTESAAVRPFYAPRRMHRRTEVHLWKDSVVASVSSCVSLRQPASTIPCRVKTTQRGPGCAIVEFGHPNLHHFHSISTLSNIYPLHCVFFAILKSTVFHPFCRRPACTGNSTYFHSPATVPERGNDESAFRFRVERLPMGEPLTVIVDDWTELKPASDTERRAAGAGELGMDVTLKRMLQTPTSPWAKHQSLVLLCPMV